MQQVFSLWGGLFIFPSYGLFLGLAYSAALVVAWYYSRSIETDTGKMLDVTLVGLLCAILGAKLLFPIFGGSASAVGRSSFGGFALGLAGLILAARWRSVRVRVILEMAGLAFPLSYSIGRVGCLLYGCCYGMLCNNSLIGVQFPRIAVDTTIVGTPAYIAHVSRGSVSRFDELSAPVIPVQAYTSVVHLLIFAVLICRLRLNNRRSDLFATSLLLCGTARFGEELLRDDNLRQYFGMSLQALLALAMAVAGYCLLRMQGAMPYAHLSQTRRGGRRSKDTSRRFESGAKTGSANN